MHDLDSPILVVIDKDEASYLAKLGELLSGVKVKGFSGELLTIAQLELSCKKHGVTRIITTREDILKKLLPANAQKEAKISNYAGSIFDLADGIELLIINPLKQLYTVKYMPWLTARFVSKLTKPGSWPNVTEFVWKFLEDGNFADLMSDLDSGIMCGVDIETAPGLRITSVSYSVLMPDYTIRTYGFFVRNLEDVKRIRIINSHPIKKVMQNGGYDISYFFMYSAPPLAYYYDTVNMMHAWMSELPKDLAFLSAIFIRKSMYWKDMGKSDDPVLKMQYNCLDTWNTVLVALAWLAEAPDWAKSNYIHEFTQVPICHQMSMLGIKRDVQLTEDYNITGSQSLAKLLKSIQTMTNHSNFNPSSPKQTLALMHVLGDKKAESTDDKAVKKSMLLHPLNERILGAINTYRSNRKELSTYLPIGEDAKEYKGRILYNIIPHGTDTGRKSSKESNFALADPKGKWKHLGLQIQNITGDGVVKDTFIADDGYEFVEIDKSQAEARGVAYCSGDPDLLEAVESENDFHSWNASAFFGVPYHEIYQNAIPEHIDADGNFNAGTEAKTLNKALRNLSKRVNHGSNYNMGAQVLLDTMGEVNVREAQRLLRLPKNYTLLQVTGYLLKTYERTYPKVKTVYYQWIKNCIRKTNKLVGPTGWTRWCFGDPSNNKLDLNSYVAHYTQNLNAMDLDEGIRRAYVIYAFDPDIKFLAQIHDSLLLLVRKTDAARAKVKHIAKLMVYPIAVTDCTGVTRQMSVPVDIKFTGDRWSGKEISRGPQIA